MQLRMNCASQTCGPGSQIDRFTVGGDPAGLLAGAVALAGGHGDVSIDWSLEEKSPVAAMQIVAALASALERQGRRAIHTGMSSGVKERISLCGLPFAAEGDGSRG